MPREALRCLHEDLDERISRPSPDPGEVKNPLSNAIKFTAEGDRIDVTAAMHEGPERAGAGLLLTGSAVGATFLKCRLGGPTLSRPFGEKWV